MKKLIILLALLGATAALRPAQAGIFGRRWQQPAQPSQSGSRAYGYAAQSRNPWDWHEAHRGYGIKIRGW